MCTRRAELLRQIWCEQNEAYDLMVEYDSLPHHYGDNILYQAEAHIIDLIALYPGITITDLSNIQKKTASACSQIVRKLRNKNWVEQSRNCNNNRQYNLTLTAKGMQVYQNHQTFCDDCEQRTYAMLDEFSDDELETALRVQRKLNEAYESDVKRSRKKFSNKQER